MKPSTPGSPGKRGAPSGGADSAAKRQAEESDVKNMFAQLLRGQRTQTEALNTFENKIGLELGNIRKEMDCRDTNLHEKIKIIQNDLDIRMMKMEDRLKADRDAEVGSQASASTAAPRGVRPAQQVHVPPDEDPCRIVFGGWLKSQRKMVVENRVLEIVNACGFVANDIYARKRGQVGFANFKNMDDVLKFMCEIKKQQFTTKTMGDDEIMWIKRSVPKNERERTKPLRCLARAMYEWWEAQASPERPEPPTEFMVDYWRQELIMQDEVVLLMQGSRMVVQIDAWARHLPDVPSDHILTTATNYMKGNE